MRHCGSEAEFQRWVVATLESIDGHVQVHREQVDVGIPDLSAAVASHDYWLELKYGRFELHHPPRGYDQFNFKELTRQQLDWLMKRAAQGGSTCGILGYVETGPSAPPITYLFFMTAHNYLEKIWRGGIDIGGILLGNYVIPAEYIKTGEHLLKFIAHARFGQAVQRSELG